MRAELARALEVVGVEVLVDTTQPGGGRLGPAQLLRQQAGAGVPQTLVLPNPSPGDEPPAVCRWLGAAPEEHALLAVAHDQINGHQWGEADNGCEGVELPAAKA